jgi:hypothetical protein
MTYRRDPIIFVPVLALLFFLFNSSLLGQSCPKIEIQTPANIISPGDAFTVRAVVKSGLGVSNFTLTWVFSSGVIEKGQGTDTVIVRSTLEDAGTNINAEVTVSGFRTVCQNKAVEQVSIAAALVCGLPADEFGALPANDVRARVDILFIQLNNSPDTMALFTMKFDEGESRDRRILRIRRILDAIKFRKYDASRITFLISNESGDLTTVRIFTLSTDMSPWINQGQLIYGQNMTDKVKTLFQNL